MATTAQILERRSIRNGDALFAGRGLYQACLAVGAISSMFAVGARWDIALAAWIAPIFLLRFLRDAGALLGIGILWLVSMANCGFWAFQIGLPLNLATFLITFAFGTVFTLPYVIDRLLAHRLPTVGRLLAFPTAYVAFEFMMGTLSPLGSGYGLKAVTQTDNLPLMQLVAITGPYGIGFLINWFATTVNWVWENPKAKNLSGIIAAYGLVITLALVGGGARLAFGTTGDSYVRVAGIAPSKYAQVTARRTILGQDPHTSTDADFEAVAQSTDPYQSKKDAFRIDAAPTVAGYALVHDDLFAGTRQAARAGARIVAWSETAAQLIGPRQRAALLEKAAQVAREENIYLNVAMGEPFANNQTVLIGPDGKQQWNYNKTNPVPGMEPIPSSRNPVPVVATPYGRLSNVICFDGDFPALARVNTDIMIIPGWDWPELGREHTLKLAVIRAIENGYSLIRVDYNGQTGAFDRFGHVLATQDTTGPLRHTMFADLPTKGSRTPYNVIGDLFAWLCVAGLLGTIAIPLIGLRKSY